MSRDRVSALLCVTALAMCALVVPAAAADTTTTTTATTGAGNSDPLAWSRAVPLPASLTVTNPTLFSHWSTGSTVTIEWVSHHKIEIPPGVLPPPLSSSDYDTLHDAELAKRGAEYRAALEAASDAANRPICDWAKGVEFTYQALDSTTAAAAGTIPPEYVAVQYGSGPSTSVAKIEWTIPYTLATGYYQARIRCNDLSRVTVYGDSVRFPIRNPLYGHTDMSVHWPTILAYVIGGFAAVSLVLLLCAWIRARNQPPLSNRAGTPTTRLSAVDIAFGRSDARRYATSGGGAAGDEEDDPTYDRVDGPQHRRVAATDD